MLKFDEIYDTYEMISFNGNMNDTSAYINIDELRILIIPSSYIADDCEIEEVEKELEIGNWIEFPTKYDLKLGKELVFRFADENFSSHEYIKIEKIFSRRNAYANLKDLLAQNGLLENWYKYSDDETKKALKLWFIQHEIPFLD